MKVAVIGTGRVGLPFALTLADLGADVVGVDIDPKIRVLVNDERRMPFLEPGFEDLVASGAVPIEANIEAASDADFVVVTVGTPLLHHIETDLSAVTRVVTQLGPVLKDGACVIMRSTTAPRTTQYVKRKLESATGKTVGKDVLLACCPERIVEGKAKEELRQLPQVIGTEDDASKEAASKLFGLLGNRLLHTDFITAELVKLSNNVARYAYFATVNVIGMIAMEYGAEPHDVLKIANDNYPRPILGKPGFTAGTCLRKDFGMLSEAYWSGDILIESWRINESLPKFLVEQTKKRFGDLTKERVAVLGYSFKKDTDDVRDSLSAKLVRYLHRECPHSLAVQDPHVAAADVEPLQGVRFTQSLEEVLAEATLILVATNHGEYSRCAPAILERVCGGMARGVDIWDCLGTGRVFIDKDTLA